MSTTTAAAAADTKKILITGAGTGLGRALIGGALELARECGASAAGSSMASAFAAAVRTCLSESSSLAPRSCWPRPWEVRWVGRV